MVGFLLQQYLVLKHGQVVAQQLNDSKESHLPSRTSKCPDIACFISPFHGIINQLRGRKTYSTGKASSLSKCGLFIKDAREAKITEHDASILVYNGIFLGKDIIAVPNYHHLWKEGIQV